MKDLAIELENRPGALAEMGEALGRECGTGRGIWRCRRIFFFADGAAAREAPERAGIRVIAERDLVSCTAITTIN